MILPCPGCETAFSGYSLKDFVERRRKRGSVGRVWRARHGLASHACSRHFEARHSVLSEHPVDRACPVEFPLERDYSTGVNPVHLFSVFSVTLVPPLAGRVRVSQFVFFLFFLLSRGPRAPAPSAQAPLQKTGSHRSCAANFL
jgi:hypothetical protein